jgi:hypothetical protein
MKWTRTVSVEVRVTPWVSVEDKPEWKASTVAAYRIWMMYDAEFGRWWQMHEWEHRGGNRERSADGWIPSWGNRFSSFPSHYIEPDEEPPQ